MKKQITFKDLKIGQVIAAGEIIEVNNRKQFKKAYTGKVIGLDSEKGLIQLQFPDGGKKFIYWVEFIIYILPLLEKIFFTVRSWFTKKKN